MILHLVRWACLSGVLLCCPNVDALDELWHYDLESSARGLPAPIDYDGDGQEEVFAATRFDGTVWSIGAGGAMRGRYRRTQWLEGSLAVSDALDGRSRLFAFQESTGLLNVADFRTGLNLVLEVPGEPRIGTAPCFGDLNRSGRQEIVCARRNGIVTAADRRLSVLWQYNGNSPFDSSPAVAPVFVGAAAVYAQSVDGVLHCIHGNGVPLWRFVLPRPAAQFPLLGDPIVVELAPGAPAVLVSDAEGWLYAVDAVSGREHWRYQAGTTALGSPAIVDVHSAEGREIVTVSAKGELSVIGAAGNPLNRASLPEGAYIARPLVADVDGDGANEVIVPAGEWRLIVASLAGAVKEEIPLQGNAREGVVLSDANRDGLLELFAVTDCARVYCLATKAREGWTHPRGGPALSGCIFPITPAYERAPQPGKRRAPSQLRVTVPDVNRNARFSTAVVDLRKSYAKLIAVAVLRQQGRVIGSAVGPVKDGYVTVPYYAGSAAPMTLDLTFATPSGVAKDSYEGIPIHPSVPIPVALPSREEFVAPVDELGKRYAIPGAWRLPRIANRDSWTVATYMPETWQRFGIGGEPFIDEAIPRINAPSTDAAQWFGPAHPAWNAMKESSTPFFLMNGYFQPEGRYPDDVYAAILGMAGDRFLGFPIHEWGYRVWKEELESGVAAPRNRQEATDALKADFARLMDMTHGRIYAGEGYCMVYHQAYAWGAPMCYAEIGENIPCAPLQFAFLRGAARQYGDKPWGAYLSNWFRGSVLDSRYLPADAPRVRWSPPEDSTGPDCGHSASLEFRLAMAAHLSGATFVHHESDAFHGSVFVREDPQDQFSLSEHGQAMKRWYDYSRKYPERGVPYTPVAFLVDFDHGWRPREPVYGIWPQNRAARSMEEMFRHVYPWGGRLDFEQGYLASGPYGDIFDVVTGDASADTLQGYGVVWPLGDAGFTAKQRRLLEDYVQQGGLLVVDSASVSGFSARFLGVSFGSKALQATGIQSALQAMPSISSPFSYLPMKLEQGTRAVAWTESGAPLVAWRRVGRGMVIVSGTAHWLDMSDTLVPLAGALLRVLADAFVPAGISADVEMLLNRTERGFVIGLINNNGVTKTPTAPAVIDPRGTRDCIVTFSGGAPQRFESRLGDFRWFIPANGLHTRIPPGGVAVVEITLSPSK